MRWLQAGGVVLMLVGLIWILQGIGVIQGSGMSGHGQYAVLGGIVEAIGVGLLYVGTRRRRADVAADPLQ